MTSRQIFEAMLIECSKVNAPSLMLDEYNYYINKAINNYINKVYNRYDINQQSTDDLRVLKSTVILSPTRVAGETTNPTSYLSKAHNQISKLNGATYEVLLPMDYYHLLNCVCVYKVNKNFKCWNGGSYVQFGAKRLTSDSWSTIINDLYNRPTPQRPYYFIHNTNARPDIPTNPVVWDEDGVYKSGTDMIGKYNVATTGQNNTNSESAYDLSENKGSNFPRVIQVQGANNSNDVVSTVERATAYRYGNVSPVRLELRYGKDSSVFELVEVQVDYIKAPQHIRLTQEQIDLTEDTSQIIEYPDYVCQKIINELTVLVMARTGDPLLQNFIPVNTTIANPAQQQAQPQQAQQNQSQN